MVESFSQLAGSVTRGVTPLVDHVRRRTPFSENPTSSRYTRVAPSATFFSQLRCDLFFPGRDPEFIALCRPPIRHLRREAQLAKDFSDVVMVIPHVKVTSNQISDPTCRPRRIGESMVHRTLPQEGAQVLVLCSCKPRGCATGNGGLKATIAS